MMDARSFALIVLVATIGTGTAQAAGEAPTTVRTLYKLRWHPTVERAKEAAAAKGDRRAKPIFWLRVLGDLSGQT
jgi:hypothetical protein